MMINSFKKTAIREPVPLFITALMHVFSIMYMKSPKISRILVIYLKN